MTETERWTADKARPSLADSSVEAAVRRLGEAGQSRMEALKNIDKALYDSLNLLNGVGIGLTSQLRQMSIMTGMKINSLRVKAANEEDARDGI